MLCSRRSLSHEQSCNESTFSRVRVESESCMSRVESESESYWAGLESESESSRFRVRVRVWVQVFVSQARIRVPRNENFPAVVIQMFRLLIRDAKYSKIKHYNLNFNHFNHFFLNLHVQSKIIRFKKKRIDNSINTNNSRSDRFGWSDSRTLIKIFL